MRPPIEYRPKRSAQRSSSQKAKPAEAESKPGHRSPALSKGGDASDTAMESIGGPIEKPSTTEVLAGASQADEFHKLVEEMREFVRRGIAAQAAVNAELEAFRESERAKVRDRVRKHRAKKRGK